MATATATAIAMMGTTAMAIVATAAKATQYVRAVPTTG